MPPACPGEFPEEFLALGPGGIRVTRSLRQRVRSGRFTVTTDRAFDRVIRACARDDRELPPDEGVWIDHRIVEAYTQLHALGHAHSVEAWLPGEDGEPVLVGGLYGVHLRGLFAGESMFSHPELGGTDASKACLVHLVAHLRRRGFTLLDTQFLNPHLERLGAVEIPRDEYQRRLETAMGARTGWLPFEPAPADADG